jgi:hypothetical protein
MTAHALAASLLLLAAFTTAAAQDKKALPFKAKDELKATLQGYVRAKTDADRERLAPLLLVWGKLGVEYLETLKEKKEYADALSLLLAEAHERLGLDILKKGQDVEIKEDYGTSSFMPDELVLFKHGDQFGGFVVDRAGSVAHEGKLKIKWWSQHGEIKRLTQPGGKSGETEVSGVKSALAMRANSGFIEYDFEVPVEETKIQIHYVGPAAFRYRLQDGIKIALTGGNTPVRHTDTDKDVAYSDRYPARLGRAAKLLQEYIFRIVPGCEPLPLEGADKAAFAQYEQVQIHVRESRPGREPVIVISFLEPENIQIASWHRRYIMNFLNEILDVKDENVLIVGGNSPSMEGNQMWNDVEWTRMNQKAVKLIRTNLPETM